MTKAWLKGFWQLGLFTLITGSAITSSKTFVLAQIQPDSTLGSESSIVNSVDANSDRIDGGAIRSTNLFHSFQEFNVGEGKAVNFANPQGIENILSRVTGNNISEIRGVLGVLGNANLFLLNPNGIIFGEDASLNVNGSFVATTANALQFGTQGIFSATNPETLSLLTVDPSALLFNQINQNAAIVNNSQAPAGQDPGGINVFGLRVPDGKSLLFVGGNVNMDGGWAIASGGHIELGGLTEAGSVGIQGDGSNFSLSFPEGVQRGDISLTNNAIVYVVADGGGSIAAHARNLEILAGSVFFAGIGEGLGNTDAQAGDITVDATEQIKLDSGLISSSTFGQGNSGNIAITADKTILLDASSYIVNNVQSSEAVGNAGKINISTGSLSVTNGSQINSFTRGQGNAGFITIQAKGTVTFDGTDSDGFPSGLFTDVDTSAVGRGGDINIQAKDIFVTDSGLIRSSTFGQGDSGNIAITADKTISLNGSSYIVNNVQSSEAVGNAGKINISTGSLSVTNGSQINSFTRGQGNAGFITIQAKDTVTFDGVDSDRFSSGLFTDVYVGAVGRGGDIKIDAGNIFIRDGGEVSTSTFGQGNAGKIEIEADNTVSLSRGYISNNVGDGGVGDSNGISIKTGSLFLTDLAQIFSDVDGRGDAGGVFIEARDIVSLVGKGDVNLGIVDFINTTDGSIITSGVNFGGEGKGGDIVISTSALRLDSSQINTSTAGKGDSGDIIINARDSVELLQGSDMFSEVTCACEEQGGGVGGIGDGGDIKITTGSLLLDIGATLRADTEARGNGGNIIINAPDNVTFRSDISTLRGGALTQVEPEAVGRGGNIQITTGTLSLSGYQEINTRTQGQGDAGNIDINANSIVLTGADVGIFSGATQEDRLPGTLGNGGEINITADSLSIYEGARISANTEILGSAGNITVDANQITLNNGSSITSESIADDELITSNDRLGKAGNISLTVRELEANNSDISTSSSQSSGGAIAINARNIRLHGDSDIRTNVASGAGSGGDITLAADSIIAFDDSDIFAFAQDGQGGNITLNTPAYFGNSFTANSFNTNPDILDNNDRADINATGAVSGVVTIPDVSFLQNSLTELPENIIDTNALVANSCIARSSDRGGTFTITGRGNLPSRPGDAAVSPYPTGDVRGVESDRTSTRRPWKIGDPIVEPQAAYRLANGQLVLSRECER
ncbi:filamentous hemagglutinin N-terminal domain-containing protein [Gloeocapsopsis sp. IPPAS B-1203]|uniref:two-partner secretion domain-containing protein n=1 Tax=Gloeocapsopsis sp. IPPAS B-1203 TaxID=2049454 RepID=UPI000C192D57|nr:filamentous hemagglutinin N-terminal domain-containing protein [Gloeocapsopsis sp. IPPAS B-1203]PIG91702.1 hypothetical protein CSQ79_19360 [Gloeocapsopsis sp. IPPAS B-1203]